MKLFDPVRAQSACCLCGTRDGTLVAVEDRHGAPLSVVCCRQCGLAHVDPIPTEAELAEFYSKRYRLEYKQAFEPSLRHVYRAGCVALDRFRLIALATPAPADVLECGAGGGEMGYLLASRGYWYTGIEPNDGYREHARSQYRTHLLPGTLDDHALPGASVDLVIMFHVLEHLRDPQLGVRTLAAALRPGGHLYIEVPNALTQVSSPSNLYHLAHLHYLATPTLLGLAQQAGLEPVLVEGAPTKANLTGIFRKPISNGAAQGYVPESAVHDAVVGANRQRTLVSYLRRPSTWLAAAGRLLRRGEEKRAAAAAGCARELLDVLYAQQAPWISHSVKS